MPGPGSLHVPGGHGADGRGDSGADGGAAARDPRLAGFAAGGRWDTCPPSAELAAVLAGVCGPGWRCPGAETGELIGLLRRWTAVESWVNAARLGVLRALLRDDDLPVLKRPRHGDLPDEWSETLAHEVAPALGVSVQSADRMLAVAWALEARLPGVAGLLADGTLTLPKARLVAETFQFLGEQDAARAEAMILPELAGKTFTQVQRLAEQAAVTVDPESAERRRRAAEKYRARVRVFREDAGTAGLSGRDLPADETLAAYASVCARAAQYKASGAFGDWAMDQYRAAAYLDLINAIPAADRIAWAQATGTTGPGPGTPGEPLPWPPDDDPDDDGPGGGPGENGPDGNAPGEDGPGGDPSGPGPGSHGPSGHHPSGGPANGGLNDHRPGSDPPDADGPNPDSGGQATDPGQGNSGDGEPGHDSRGNVPATGGCPQGQFAFPPPWLAGRPVLTDLVIPLVTLLGVADRPGEGHSLGTLDPQLCRHLAAVAIRSPHTTLCVTVTDADGIAIGHGCAGDRFRRGPNGLQVPWPPGAGPPPLTGLPARINLTIPAATLTRMLADTALADTAGRLPTDTALTDPVLTGTGGRPLTRAPCGWAFTPEAARPLVGTGNDGTGNGEPGGSAWLGTWVLTLPGGLPQPVRLIAMPTYDCDHAHESHGYQPNDTLRHLVQIRDYTCTFMTCTRLAGESDFEHALPYDQGGRTCACNAGARSRKCHRQKQSPGWKVTQPRPGWHRWETPSGRVYTQGPKRYPA